MKISTEIGSAAKIVGEEKAVEYVARAGFDAWDFSMFSMCNCDWKSNTLLENDHPLAGGDYLRFARRLKQIALDNGIVCNQAHAPFPSRCPELRSYFKRAIECTAEVGGKICVIHPDNDSSPEKKRKYIMKFCPLPRSAALRSPRKICGTGIMKKVIPALPPVPLPKASMPISML